MDALVFSVPVGEYPVGTAYPDHGTLVTIKGGRLRVSDRVAGLGEMEPMRLRRRGRRWVLRQGREVVVKARPDHPHDVLAAYQPTGRGPFALEPYLGLWLLVERRDKETRAGLLVDASGNTAVKAESVYATELGSVRVLAPVPLAAIVLLIRIAVHMTRLNKFGDLLGDIHDASEGLRPSGG